MVGPQLAGHLYGELPGLAWPLLPAGFVSSHSLTRSPCSWIGFQETKLGSDWLPRSSLTGFCSSHPQQHISQDGPQLRQPTHLPTHPRPAQRLGTAAAHWVPKDER